jgi:hypothetical protein
MLERLRDPALFSRDIVATRPHLAYTVYDETALAMKRITHADFESVLTGEQLVFRAFAIWGLILIALRLGLSASESFFVAAVVSLGATIAGPAVLTFEYEPVPRGFALGLIVFALGLIADERYLSAGAAAGVAFLYHPPTMVPFWGLAIVLVIARRLRWTILAPLAIAGVLLAVLARIQPQDVETTSMLDRLDPFQETLQRFRASYSFVSSWMLNQKLDFAVQAAIAALALWRVRKIVHVPLRDFLWGLPLIGLLSMPLSRVLLEHERWALIPQWQPARAVLFVSLMVALLSSIAAIKATNLAERWLWLTAAFLMPLQHAMVLRQIHYRPLFLAAALALLTTALCAFRKEWLVLAGLIPFVAIPQAGVVENYPRVLTTDLRQLAD